MRTRRAKLFVVLGALAGLGVLSCSGSSSSPTSPGTLQVVITSGMLNTALSPTILEAQCLFDGVIAADTSSATPIPLASLNSAGTTSTGSHTMVFTIVSQTSSPNGYTVAAPDIQVFDAAGNFLRDVKLSNQSATLATGQSITYNFTL